MAKKLQITSIKENVMNVLFKSKVTNEDVSKLNPVIKVCHFDDNKPVMTKVYPISHFLDKSSREIKSLRYS